MALHNCGSYMYASPPQININHNDTHNHHHDENCCDDSGGHDSSDSGSHGHDGGHTCGFSSCVSSSDGGGFASCGTSSCGGGS